MPQAATMTAMMDEERSSRRTLTVTASEPARALEADVEDAAGGDDDRHDEGIAEAPLQLRHELEVHPVDAGDHGGDADDGRPARELLHGVVLGYRDEREMGLEGPREQLALAVHRLVDADGVVVDVAEVRPGVVGDEGQVEAHQAIAHVDEGRHRALDLEQVALEVVDA